MKKNKCKCKKVECPPSERWAVPTADFFSLLLALFIALFAIASVNTEKVKALKEEFVKIYDYAAVPEATNPVLQMVKESKEAPESTSSSLGQIPILTEASLSAGSQDTSANQRTSESETTSEVIEKIRQELKKASLSGSPLDQTVDGVLLKLPTAILFQGASTKIVDTDIELFIRRIAHIINSLPSSVSVSVRGYTDDMPPPSDSIFKDNIELSTSRANVVMRELIKNGVSQQRLSIAGFGSTKPIRKNNNEENRAKNRRVEFFMFVSDDTPLDKEDKSTILDALEKLKK